MNTTTSDILGKAGFLKQLGSHLKNLPSGEADEILADYRNHFEEAVARGRSEEETAAALGDPKWLAQEHLRDKAEDTQHPKSGLSSFIERLLRLGQPNPKRADGIVERDMGWKPGRSMVLAIPAEVHWRPGETSRAQVKGPEWLLEHIRLDAQGLRGRFKWRFFQRNHIRIDLEGPAIEQWTLIGGGTLHLHDIAQSTLHLDLNGSGDIKADGCAQNVIVTMNGSGDIDLGSLEHEAVTVDMKGMGDATVAPTKIADLSIAGSGDIVLTTKPETIKTAISGGGDIRWADGSSVEDAKR